jgi:hypothetical protein
MAEQKEKSTLSVREFRMWLQGVEEMQGDDWSPSPLQWAKIRNKIDNIQDLPTPALPPTVFPQHRQIEPAIFTAPQQPQQAMVPVMPAGPSSLSIPPQRQMPNPLLAVGGNVKTPDIDTSAKGYESGFV